MTQEEAKQNKKRGFHFYITLYTLDLLIKLNLIQPQTNQQLNQSNSKSIYAIMKFSPAILALLVVFSLSSSTVTSRSTTDDEDANNGFCFEHVTKMYMDPVKLEAFWDAKAKSYIEASATTEAIEALTMMIMMDEARMTKLALREGFNLPTSQEYAAKVLQYTKLALKFKKENDIWNATQYLRSAKQLEHVAKALYSNHNHVDENAPTDETAGRMTSMLSSCTAEERELLGELYDPTSSGRGDDGDGKEELRHIFYLLIFVILFVLLGVALCKQANRISTNYGTNTASTSDIDNNKLSITKDN